MKLRNGPPPSHRPKRGPRLIRRRFAVALVSALALTLRVLANVVRRMSKVLITVYDVVIVLPLMAERLTKAGMAMRHSAVDADDTAYKTR